MLSSLSINQSHIKLKFLSSWISISLISLGWKLDKYHLHIKEVHIELHGACHLHKGKRGVALKKILEELQINDFQVLKKFCLKFTLNFKFDRYGLNQRMTSLGKPEYSNLLVKVS